MKIDKLTKIVSEVSIEKFRWKNFNEILYAR